MFDKAITEFEAAQVFTAAALRSLETDLNVLTTQYEKTNIFNVPRAVNITFLSKTLELYLVDCRRECKLNVAAVI